MSSSQPRARGAIVAFILAVALAGTVGVFAVSGGLPSEKSDTVLTGSSD